MKTTKKPAKQKEKKPKHPHAGDFKKGNEFRFKPGNELWRRSLLVRREYPDANSFLAACAQYFEWVDENPLLEQVAAQFQGTYVKDKLNKLRPYTIEGLCLFIGLPRMTLHRMESEDEFAEAVERVRAVIYEQKFSGAAAGFFNATIVARDLGLKEQTATEHSGRIDYSDLSDDEINARIRQHEQQQGEAG